MGDIMGGILYAVPFLHLGLLAGTLSGQFGAKLAGVISEVLLRCLFGIALLIATLKMILTK